MTFQNARSGEGRYDGSAKLNAKARQLLVGGVSSNFRLGGTPHPLTFRRGEGSRVYDVDGNEYLDYMLGMGPAILGHAPEVIRQAVINTLDGGQLYAGQSEQEIALAQLLCELLPVAERVRLSVSGSEAIQGAIRLARAATGRNKILKFEGHYHGWLDGELVSVHPPVEEAGPAQRPLPVLGSAGQPPSVLADVLVARWNDAEHLEHLLSQHGTDVAAVLMEPIMCNTAVIAPRPGYLERVRELCHAHGVLLIFDEVITGFRVDVRGAHGLLGLTPDLACFAKGLGGGFPISCIAGRADLMDLAEGSVMHGGTYNAQVAGVAAALATVRALEDGQLLDQVRQRGKRLGDGIRKLAMDSNLPLVVQGFGCVFHTNFGNAEATDYRSYVEIFDLAMLARFVRALQDRGVRITLRGTWFVSAAHSDEDIEHTLDAVGLTLTDMRDGRDALANS